MRRAFDGVTSWYAERIMRSEEIHVRKAKNGQFYRLRMAISSCSGCGLEVRGDDLVRKADDAMVCLSLEN